MHGGDAIASLRSQPYEHAALFIAADSEVLERRPCPKAAIFCARYCGLALSAQQFFGFELAFCQPDDHGWASPQLGFYTRTHVFVVWP